MHLQTMSERSHLMNSKVGGCYGPVAMLRTQTIGQKRQKQSVRFVQRALGGGRTRADERRRS
jgi:hypothetical protein